MTDAPKETLLFVDDEESILEVASEYFMAKGYHILTAENGRIAVDIIAKEKIDCCFTDINMPEMDGLELAEHIRMVDNTIPVIIMTGYPSSGQHHPHLEKRCGGLSDQTGEPEPAGNLRQTGAAGAAAVSSKTFF